MHAVLERDGTFVIETFLLNKDLKALLSWADHDIELQKLSSAPLAPMSPRSDAWPALATRPQGLLRLPIALSEFIQMLRNRSVLISGLTWDGKREGSVALPTVNTSSSPSAPKDFRAKINQKLHALWQQELGGLPKCKKVPQVLVSTLRTDGFALGRIATQGSVSHGEGSQKAVTSYVAFWAIRNDHWKQVIGTAGRRRLCALAAGRVSVRPWRRPVHGGQRSRGLHPPVTVSHHLLYSVTDEGRARVQLQDLSADPGLVEQLS